MWKKEKSEDRPTWRQGGRSGGLDEGSGNGIDGRSTHWNGPEA